MFYPLSPTFFLSFYFFSLIHFFLQPLTLLLLLFPSLHSTIYLISFLFLLSISFCLLFSSSSLSLFSLPAPLYILLLPIFLTFFLTSPLFFFLLLSLHPSTFNSLCFTLLHIISLIQTLLYFIISFLLHFLTNFPFFIPLIPFSLL